VLVPTPVVLQSVSELPDPSDGRRHHPAILCELQDAHRDERGRRHQAAYDRYRDAILGSIAAQTAGGKAEFRIRTEIEESEVRRNMSRQILATTAGTGCPQKRSTTA
jgi:hypothetical protein